jgi:hypothetical protein
MLKNRNYMSADTYIQQSKEYDKWIKEVRVFTNKTVMIFIVVGILVLLIGRSAGLTFLAGIGGFVTFYYIIELAKRTGHKEGYLDGYEASLQDSRHASNDDDLDFLNEE